MPAEPTLEALRAAILRVFPEHAGADFRLLVQGFDSIAVDVDRRLIFKFPRHAEAEERLKTEARVLDAIRPAVTMRVPALTLHSGPPLFSWHEKLQGEHLLAADYEKLPDEARARLAADMARFYAELHALDPRAMEAAGARPVGTWLPADDILRLALPLLPPALHGYAERTIAAYRRLPPDPLGTTFGFFDGHGWNMAFDHAGRRLNGVYDFGDSGFGPLHMEFVQPGWISRDHVERVVREYEHLTGRALDRGRIGLLSAVLRLSELGGFAKDPGRLPAAIRAVKEWAACRGDIELMPNTVRLRNATLEDMPVLRRWDAEPHVREASGDDGPFDWENQIPRDVDWRELLIAEVDGRPIGFIQIIDAAREETHYWGDAEPNLRAIDIWIGEKTDLGRGYGTEMMRLAIDRCFADPEVTAILIDPLERNFRARRFYERLGFVAVGPRRFGTDDCMVYRLERDVWFDRRA